MSVLNIAIIGGGIISRAHLSAARNSGGRVKVVASVDSAEDARASLAQATDGAPVFFSIGELLERRDLKVDAIVVCTPPSVRLPVVKPALERGIGVLVEKPLAHTLDDAKALAELASRHPKVAAAVGYCHRFVPAMVEMKRRLGTGELGDLIRFENIFASFIPSMRQRWMSDPQLSGGGSFIDTGCHSLDLFRFLIGDGKVVGAVFQNHWPGRGESSATVLLRRGEVTGVIASGWLEPVRFTVNLIGTRGLLRYDYDRPNELLYRPSEGAPQVLEVSSHDTRFERQLLAFADFAQRGERGSLADFADGLRVAELVDGARHASII